MLVEIEVRQLELAEFADAEAAAVERLHDGQIALAVAPAQVNGGFHAVDFVHRQHRRQTSAYLGRDKEFGGVLLHHVLQIEETVEGAHAAEDACLATGFYADMIEARREVSQILQLGILRTQVAAGEEGEQLTQILHIGLDGVRGERLLQLQVDRIVVAQRIQLLATHAAEASGERHVATRVNLFYFFRCFGHKNT